MVMPQENGANVAKICAVFMLDLGSTVILGSLSKVSGTLPLSVSTKFASKTL